MRTSPPCPLPMENTHTHTESKRAQHSPHLRTVKPFFKFFCRRVKRVDVMLTKSNRENWSINNSLFLLTSGKFLNCKRLLLNCCFYALTIVQFQLQVNINFVSITRTIIRPFVFIGNSTCFRHIA